MVTKITCVDCKFLKQGEFHCFCSNPDNKDIQLKECILSIDIYDAPNDCKVFTPIEK